MNNLLVPVDLSEISNTIISRAACLAQHCASKIWLLHVILPEHETVPFNVDRRLLRKEAAKGLHYQRQQLHELADQFRKVNIKVFPYHIPGDIGKTILKEAKRVEADLIIMGTHGHGNVYHAVFGGVGQKIIRQSSCPVMLVSRHETRPCEYWKQKILGMVHHDVRVA